MKLARLQPRIATLNVSRVRIEGSAKPENRDSLYGRKWKKLSKLFLMANPLCLRCKRDGRVTMATIVHHVIPHRGDETLFWDRSNWQAMAKACHDRKTAREDGAFGRGEGRSQSPRR